MKFIWHCITLWLALMFAPMVWADASITPWPKGKAVPALALADLEGRPWSLEQLRGKVVLLNFWATWCEPCREEMPSLVALSRQYPERLLVLAVNYQENPAKINRFLEAVPLSFPVLLDREGAATKAWTRRIFPTSVLLDVRGQPQVMVLGEFDWAGPQAQRLIGPLMKPAPAQVSMLRELKE